MSEFSTSSSQFSSQEAETRFDEKKYPTLRQFVTPLHAAARKIVGREADVVKVLSALARLEMCNPLLLAEAGVGKSSLVQATMLVDSNRSYWEVNLEKMVADYDPVAMASYIKMLFDEAQVYHRESGEEIVLFMDEIHRLMDLSPMSVEAIKPVLASSGSYGLKIIAATTKAEYLKFIAPNIPLAERFQRIDLEEPDRPMVIAILRGFVERYGKSAAFPSDHMFELIYDYAQRYVPDSAQPRKSIKLLDEMFGWHAVTKRPMDEKLLADVVYSSTGNNVAFRVDVDNLEKYLNSRVLSQRLAVRAVAKRVHLGIAGMNDPNKPMGTFLFAGSTGVGKALPDDTRVPVFTEDGLLYFKTMSELVPGVDRVFTPAGVPTRVLGSFPQGMRESYRLTFSDGRTQEADGEHIWPIYTTKLRDNKHKGKPVTHRLMTTQEMFENGVVRTYAHDDRRHMKYFVPMNGAVQWPEADLNVHPYVVGSLISNGCMTQSVLGYSSNDVDQVERVADLLGTTAKKSSDLNYNWTFANNGSSSDRCVVLQQRDVVGDMNGLFMTKSAERRIPAAYMHGSVEQRWDLVRGLFDTDGTIGGSNDRFNVSYSTFSEGLADDVRELLFSLGIQSTTQVHTRERENEAGEVRVLVEYDVHVKVGNDEKTQFFWLPRKHEIAEAAVAGTAHRTRVKKFDMVGIVSIEKLDAKVPMTCILVEDEEHLFQCGQFLVTHNTELSKALAEALFGDAQRHFIRFDLAEYANDEMLERFREELTARVWGAPFSVILLDEVEKASPAVSKLLLSVLDDARLTNANGREVSFRNSWIILTTNAGSQAFKSAVFYAEDVDDGLRDYQKLIARSIRDNSKSFPTELYNRIQHVAPFRPLSAETKSEIIKLNLAKIYMDVRRRHGVRIVADDRVQEYLAFNLVQTDTDDGGARGAIRAINDEIASAVAEYINKNPQARVIKMGVEGILRSEDKFENKTNARIVISAG